jgi:hypothetical protein
MIAYHTDGNLSLQQVFQTKADKHCIPAFNTIMARLAACGLLVDLNIRDNKASEDFKRVVIESWKTKFQLVLPDMHQRNKVERMIRHFKNGFLSILASIDAAFPPYLWDLLLPQAKLTVNLLRQATINPKISAWEYLNCPFDFNKTPLAPVGCRVLIQAKLVMQRSWDYRAKQGFYLGPALDHYRCYKLVNSDTKQKVILDTVKLRHAYLQILMVLADDKIINGRQVMAGALQNAPPPTSSNQLDAIETILTLFEKWTLLAPPALQNDSPAVGVPEASAPPSPCRVLNTTPASNRTNNLFHALKSDDNDTLSVTTWSPPPLLASVPRTPAQHAQVVPFQQTTPTRLVFDDVPSPSGLITTPQPSQLPLSRMSETPSPIAHCTRSRLAPPQHRSLVALVVQYHIPTAKATQHQYTFASQFADLFQALVLSEPESTDFACLYARLSTLNEGHSLAVLDKESGQLLEHCQLQQDPCYKEVWDRSYSNELGRLCQGIGTGDKAGSKWVAGTNTFHLIPYLDIPH